MGTLLDGTFQKTQKQAPDGGGVTGRIKFGTESNGGFKNITITNCTFDHCRGLALETVDGGILEDIAITNITMNDITNVPIFLRLGSCMRAPEGTEVGIMRRIIINNVIVNNTNPEYGSLIVGIPGHPIEDVKLSNIQILVKGGSPKEYMDIEVPELEDGYPDPRFFGKIPAYGFFIRHAKNIEFNNVEIRFIEEDYRPAFVLDDVTDADFYNVKIQKVQDIPTFMLKDVQNFKTRECSSIEDTDLEHIDHKKL
jgi:polygalacturonase